MRMLGMKAVRAVKGSILRQASMGEDGVEYSE